jgi:hypothetical protein
MGPSPEAQSSKQAATRTANAGRARLGLSKEVILVSIPAKRINQESIAVARFPTKISALSGHDGFPRYSLKRDLFLQCLRNGVHIIFK